MKEKSYKDSNLYKFWLILEWIDMVMNHGIVQWIFDLFPFNETMFWIWERTIYKFCTWIVGDLFDKWFPDADDE